MGKTQSKYPKPQPLLKTTRVKDSSSKWTEKKARDGGVRKCKNCRKNEDYRYWCQSCNSARFSADFWNWTSGNKLIDEFIQYAQLTAKSSSDVLEWVPFAKFVNARMIAKGGYGAVYTASWFDGNIVCWQASRQRWVRRGSFKVALKAIGDSRVISDNLLSELRAVRASITLSIAVLRCYGITQDPLTGKYMLILDYAAGGDLHNYLRTDFAEITWTQRLQICYHIVLALSDVHKSGLTHKNLHSGNILQHNFTTKVTDFGLCQSTLATNSMNEVYGVLPYTAPEVIQRKPCTMASDIYSFGMIMWEVASGVRPFSKVPQDIHLALDICNGLRPEVIVGTPNCYAELMMQCWHKDPEKRPTAHDLAATFREWIYVGSAARDVQREFQVAEENGFEYAEIEDNDIDSSADYISRPLPNPLTIVANASEEGCISRQHGIDTLNLSQE